MKPVSMALVGCGALAELYYAPVFLELQRQGFARLEAIVDPDASRRAVLLAQFPGAAQAESIEKLALTPELAVVASPARFHAEQAIALLNRGALVLCEKPMAATVAEAERMIVAARGRLAVGLFRRFFPAARLIKDYLAAEVLGKAVRFEFTEGGVFDWPAQSASFFQKKTAQGGVLLDLGVHLFDLALWWFGEPAAVDYEDDAMGGLEINAVARLSFASGLRGVAQLSRDWNLPNRYVIHCEKGWLAWKVGEANQIEIGVNGSALAVKGTVHQSLKLPASLGNVAAGYSESFVLQMLNCLGAARGGEALAIPGEEGIRSLRLIERCYRERHFLRAPWFTEKEAERAAALASP